MDIPRNIKKVWHVAEMIYALLTGRAMSLLLKAFLVYVLYLVIHRISTPEHVATIALQFESGPRKYIMGSLPSNCTCYRWPPGAVC